MSEEERAAFRAAAATTIRVEAARASITQSVLAERAGVSTGAISYYWHGTREPRLSDAAGIAEALGLDMVEFTRLIVVELARGQEPTAG
ncbi:helix-turn-helix domain-containing protein [Isoptericola sp. NPDC056578]|uniref:helix-turn-helix domain-containing protein n=1 Tax=unclassified Isoptericola TaxID=2623355 RepID=UPI0036CA7F55